ncbi:MAG: hypothetical protein ABI200_03850 [Gaiellales bacterium]
MRTLLVVSIIVLALIGAVAQRNRSEPPTRNPASSTTTPKDASHTRDSQAQLRTVIVGAKAKVGVNDGTMRVAYERGATAPSSAQVGEVVTDENCEPDAEGVSHCRNNIRLKSGKTIRVQHAHKMHDVPCLVPGERVQIRAA